ncbi:DUF1877 family protein [Peptostreptococcus equinus]|uniref:DUF1877 family protein n=1 Tax=Peptostreptococcus equinus TaxID=3003601 RepID=A0ABY7JU94_9FIRM|nr:DUF1877 family protein [Peptostreptococcus sp. CBA3647]WAW15540.1 DUF1877 family protein [Peptostreptococcus sp. CBA3647]
MYTAEYRQVSNEELNKLIHSEDKLEFLETIDLNDLNSENIETLWDGLHFLFTKKPANSIIKNNPLSVAILGQNIIGDEYISYIDNYSVSLIYKNLKHYDIENALKNVDFEDFIVNEIYPNTWTQDREKMAEDIKYYFYKLKDFYKSSYEKNNNVVVSII